MRRREPSNSLSNSRHLGPVSKEKLVAPVRLPPRARETIDEAELNRVHSGKEDDGNSRGSRFCGSHCRAAVCHDHTHAPSAQLVRELPKSLVPILNPPIFDRDIAALHVAKFPKSVMEFVQEWNRRGPRSG